MDRLLKLKADLISSMMRMTRVVSRMLMLMSMERSSMVRRLTS